MMDEVVEAAIRAVSERARQREPDTARWPDDYEEAEQAEMRDDMRAAIEAADATRAPLRVKPGTNATYTIDDMIREAKRELTMRHRVYWGWVDAGRMTREDANKKIALQEAIVDALVRVKVWHWPDAQKGLDL